MVTKKTHTTKKVTVIGRQDYINQTTGEVEHFHVIQEQDRDFDFHKVWLHSIIDSLDLIGNKKTKLAFWNIDHLDRENKLTMNYRQIAEKSGISLDTVRKTMKTLIDADFMRRINQGAYCINPDVIFKGSRNGRLNILIRYEQLAAPNPIIELDPIDNLKQAESNDHPNMKIAK